MTVHHKIRFEKRLMLRCFRTLDEAIDYINKATEQLTKEGATEMKMDLDKKAMTVTISGFKDV